MHACQKQQPRRRLRRKQTNTSLLSSLATSATPSSLSRLIAFPTQLGLGGGSELEVQAELLLRRRQQEQQLVDQHLHQMRQQQQPQQQNNLSLLMQLQRQYGQNNSSHQG